MRQGVTNQTERQVGILQFAAIFSMTVGLTCFVLLQIFDVSQAIPEAELQSWREKAPLIRGLGELGNRLVEYEQSAQTNPMQMPTYEAKARQQSAVVHTSLIQKGSSPMYSDLERILRMADHYMAFVRQSSATNLPEKMRLQQLTGEVERLKQQLDEQRQQNADLRTQLIICQQK